MSDDMKKLADVSEDIISFKVPDEILNMVAQSLYSIARKHGIKRGTASKGGGIIMNNPEWTMIQSAFLDHISHEIEYHFILDDTPEDILK